MIAPGALLRLVRADYLERVRRYSFLMTLGFTLYAAYMFLPPNHAHYVTLNLGGHRGIYNSAWVGCVIAMLATTFLTFAGFYLTKDAIGRDRRSGVGSILAATPLRSSAYLLAKFFSNLAVTGSMVLVLIVAAAIMQIVRGEDTHVQALPLVAPFMVITLPAMALVAAVAVIFEVTPLLRGGFGNVAYFVLWMATVSLTTAVSQGWGHDPLGTYASLPQMREAVHRAFPSYPAVGGPLTMGFNIKGSGGVWDLQTFVWEGMRWTPGIVVGRLAWMVVAVVMAMASAIVFDRFDTRIAPARVRAPRGKKRAAPAAANGDAAPEALAPATHVHLGSLGEASRSSTRLGALVIAELRLMLHGVSRWWWIVALGLTVACAFVPLPVMRRFLLPFALIWPLLRWSPMGTRESFHRTEGIVFSTPRPIIRLLLAQWLAGVVVALFIGAGAIAHRIVIGDGAGLVGLLAGLAFIPSFALACGTWTGNGRLFDVLYMLLWYAGPIEQIPLLDFGSPDATTTVRLAVATVVLLGLSWAGRRRRLGA